MDPRLRNTLALGLGVVLAGALLPGCQRRSTPVAPKDTRPTVAATVYPIADIVRELAGERVRILVVVPPGEVPQGYVPPESHVEQLREAGLLIRVGRGLDDAACEPVLSAGEDRPKTFTLDEATAGGGAAAGAPSPASTRPTTSGDRAPTHDLAKNPYLWLDPVRAVRIADVISRALIEFDPENKAAYQTNAKQVVQQLEELHELCRREINAAPRKVLATVGSHFGHFARRYGLRHLVLPWDADGTVAPQVERIVGLLAKHPVKTIFADPRFPVDVLESIAAKAHVHVDRLDPLGAPGVIGHDGYIALMQTNLATLVQGLSKEGRSTATLDVGRE